MVVSALNIVYQTIAKYYADKYYDTLRDSFYSDEMQTDNISYLSRDTVFPAEERLYSDDGDIYSAPDLVTVDMHEKYERMLPNLQALKKINTNVFAWIKVEGTRVDYPVVRSPQGNNDYYLDHALDRTYSVSGSVFMDYTNAIKLSNNRNTCIYGHNMNDGTMFQTIMNFRTRNQFLNGQIEVYTADGIYIYTPFSVYDAVPTERFFHTQFADDTDFGSFLEEITSKSIFKAGVTPDIKDKVITLITCTNTVTDKRFVVHGVLTDVVK
jgi:sortase B